MFEQPKGKRNFPAGWILSCSEDLLRSSRFNLLDVFLHGFPDRPLLLRGSIEMLKPLLYPFEPLVDSLCLF
jgi:hypothetical protein